MYCSILFFSACASPGRSTYQVNQKFEGLIRDEILGKVQQNFALARSVQLDTEGTIKSQFIACIKILKLITFIINYY